MVNSSAAAHAPTWGSRSESGADPQPWASASRRPRASRDARAGASGSDFPSWSAGGVRARAAPGAPVPPGTAPSERRPCSRLDPAFSRPLTSGSSRARPPSASPASADATAFWGYWQASGSTWAFAKTGPATAHPKDGAVEGWRFAKSSGDTGTPPRDKPDFAKICGSTAAKSGGERVAVVLDYGVPGRRARRGQRRPPPRRPARSCPRRHGLRRPRQGGATKTDKSGLICAIDAFGPCGGRRRHVDAARAAPASARGEKEESAGSTALSIGVGLLLVLAAGGSIAVGPASDAAAA